MKFSEEVTAIFNKLIELYFDNIELFIEKADNVDCPIYIDPDRYSNDRVEIGHISIESDDPFTFISVYAKYSDSNLKISISINEWDDQNPPMYSLSEAETYLKDIDKEIVIKELTRCLSVYFGVSISNDNTNMNTDNNITASLDIIEEFNNILSEVNMTKDTSFNELVKLTKTYEYLSIMLVSAKESGITFNNTARVSLRFLERRLLDIKTIWNIYYNIASILEDGNNIREEDLNLLKLRIER